MIEKKILSKWFDLVASGKKRWEIRIADFDINEGDTFLLREWNPVTKEYTGRTIEKPVGYVAKFSLEDLYKLNSEEEIKKHGLQIITLE